MAHNFFFFDRKVKKQPSKERLFEINKIHGGAQIKNFFFFLERIIQCQIYLTLWKLYGLIEAEFFKVLHHK